MPPISGIARLSKSIFRISGADSTKFLNGLVTSRMLPHIEKKKQHTISDTEKKFDLTDKVDVSKNYGIIHEDIYDPDHTIFIRRDGLYSMFLNSKGRVLWDCYIYPDPFWGKVDSVPSYLIEVDSSYVDSLKSVLKLHKLGAKVKIKLTDLESLYFYNDTPEFDLWLEDLQFNYLNSYTTKQAESYVDKLIKSGEIFDPKSLETPTGFAIDNRIPNFGLKLIGNWNNSTSHNIDVSKIFSTNFLNKFGSPQLLEQDEITERRYINGLFESQDSISDHGLLPFETNLDFTNGLSIEKGCYVGQELTIRTLTSGVIRKRIFPIQFFDPRDVETVENFDGIYLKTDNISNIIQELEPQMLQSLLVQPFYEQQQDQQEKKENITASTTAPSPFGTSTVSPRKRRNAKSMGKLLSVKKNVGFMLAATEDIKKNVLYKINVELKNGEKIEVGVKAWYPDWWPEN